MAKGPLTIPGLTPSRGGRAGGLRIPGLQAPRRENRRLPRLSIDEINARGIEAVREAGIPFKPSDRRSAFEKVLDWVDVPRAAVAQVIARVAGMTSKDIAKLRDEGTFGKQIWTSDILKHLGVKNRVARAIFGFIGDVAIDPLTYLTAGATTAKTLFKGAPKVLPGGMKALRQTTKAAVRGGLAGISDDVLKATGTTAEQIRKIGRAMLRQAKGSNKKAGKRLNRWLIRRLGTRTHGARGLEAADAARQFFVKFGERGRTILRVPFTQAKLTAKQGRRARLFKEFTEPVLGSVQALGTRAARSDLAQQIVTTAALRRGTQKVATLGEQGKLAREGITQAKALAAFQAKVLFMQRWRNALRAKDAARKLRAIVQAAGRARTPRAGFTPLQKVEARRLLAIIKGAGVTKAEMRLIEQAALAPGGEALLAQLRQIETKAEQIARQASIATAQAVSGKEGMALFDAAGLNRATFTQKELAEISAKIRAGAFDTPKARRAAEAVLKKEIRQQLKSGAKGVLQQPGEFAKQAAAVQKEVISPAAEELIRIRFDPLAAESIKALTQSQFGKFRPLVTPRDASLFKRAEVYINRVKASLFGGGWSPTQTEFASAAQAVGSGADAANATAVAHFTKMLDPLIDRLVARSGLTKVEVHQRMWDFIDSGNFKKLASDDPVLARMNETIRLFGFGDDAEEGKKLVEMFREFGDTHREAIDAMKRAGVAPDELFGSAPRKITEEFRARSDPFTEQVLPELSFTDSRTHELRRINRRTGEIERAYTAKTSRAAKQRNALKALDDAEWGPVQEFDISGFRHNTDQNLLTALVPPGEKGTFNQFRASIPEAAGAIAAQKTRRLAYGRIRDLVLPTSISAEALADNPAAFAGFAQLRLEKFKNSPAFPVMSVLEGRAFPIQVVDQLHQFMHVASRPREINRLLRASDGLFGVWKGVTLLHPAYTLRNIVQNVIGTSMAGIRLRPMLRQSRPGSPVSKIVGDVLAGRTPTGFIVVSGQTWDAQRFGDLLVQHNLIGSGIVSQISDVADTTRSFFSKITGGTLRRWFRINNQIESTMKAAAFWSALDEGTDLATALQKVARAMPDLTDLTRFEREGMKRVFPWYSWMRKNGALQLFHFLPNKPAFIAAPGKAQEAWEEAFSGNSVVPDELRPQWMREQQAVQVSGDNVSGTVFLSASWLPFQELVKLGSGLTDIRAGATALLESMRPGIRVLPELATGRDIFRREEVEPLRPQDIPGQILPAIRGKSRTPLDTLLAIRPIREAFGRVPEVAEEQGVGAAALRGVLGGAFQPVSAERGLRDLDVRTARLMIKIRSKMNAANRKGDLQAVKRLLIQFVQLMRERIRLGLPISKASTQALSAAGLSPQEAFPGLQGAMR